MDRVREIAERPARWSSWIYIEERYDIKKKQGWKARSEYIKWQEDITCSKYEVNVPGILAEVKREIWSMNLERIELIERLGWK